MQLVYRMIMPEAERLSKKLNIQAKRIILRYQLEGAYFVLQPSINFQNRFTTSYTACKGKHKTCLQTK